MNIGAGCEVPRRRACISPAARHAGYRGMDNMHSPRAASPRVNALCGTPPGDDVLQYPRSYMLKGRAPVSAHDRPRLVSGAFSLGILGESPRLSRL